MLMRRVDKPVLLRRLFQLGCQYSGQILSLTKILGPLQEPGNTETLSHYLELLKRCGLLEGLQKCPTQWVRQRASSPKFQVHNNALITSQPGAGLTPGKARTRPVGPPDRVRRGRTPGQLRAAKPYPGVLLAPPESGSGFRHDRGDQGIAIEVKSPQRCTSLPGIVAFAAESHVHRTLLVGSQGMPLEEFLAAEPDAWF